MVGKFIIFISLFLYVHHFAVVAEAYKLTADYKKCGTADNAIVLTGDTIHLPTEGIIKLADIKSPEFWPQDSPYKSWPYAQASKKALQKLLSQEKVSLYCGKQQSNFLGEKIRHLVLEENTSLWVQEYLVKHGHAFLFPDSKSPTTIKQLYLNEDQAKHDKAGLWGISTYKVTAAMNTDEIRPGWFQIVRGKVHAAKKVRNKTYLNFEENWREDFTIEISGKILRTMKKQGLDPLAFAGKTIEVRGWVEWAGGPKIILSSPNRLRIISLAN